VLLHDELEALAALARRAPVRLRRASEVALAVVFVEAHGAKDGRRGAECPGATPEPPGYRACMPSADTSREAREAQLAAWRRIGASGRVELAWKLSESEREISIEGMLQSDSELTRETARRRLLRRLLGEALFESAYPKDRSSP
jgi:hypothetical protein